MRRREEASLLDDFMDMVRDTHSLLMNKTDVMEGIRGPR